MRTGIYRTDTGALEMVAESFDATVEDMTGRAIIDVPDAWPIDLAWDEASKTFGPNLSGWRADRWAAALAYREQVARGGCATPSGRVQTDPDSQRKISGAATAALVAKTQGQAFSVNWTMADNSVAQLDADQMIAMGMAVVSFLAACQDAGTAIRNAIDAADDKAAIEAVDITAGYPA